MAAHAMQQLTQAQPAWRSMLWRLCGQLSLQLLGCHGNRAAGRQGLCWQTGADLHESTCRDASCSRGLVGLEPHAQPRLLSWPGVHWPSAAAGSRCQVSCQVSSLRRRVCVQEVAGYMCTSRTAAAVVEMHASRSQLCQGEQQVSREWFKAGEVQCLAGVCPDKVCSPQLHARPEHRCL